MIVPQSVRNSLPGLYDAPLAMLSIAKNAKTGQFEISETIKETVDPVGLGEFHEMYFGRGTLYRDVELQYYKAFGDKSISLIPTWNPFKLYQWYYENYTRLVDKNIGGNLTGEGFKQGGILIFDKGELKYAQEELVGEPLDMDALRNAIQEVFSTPQEV